MSMSDSSSGGSSETRMPYFRSQAGKTELVFVSDFYPNGEFPAAVFFTSYKPTLYNRSGKPYYPTFAYYEEDGLHPSWIEQKESEGKDPLRSMSSSMLALVFNKTAYNMQKKTGRLTSSERAYRENWRESEDVEGAFVWEAGKQIIDGLTHYVKEEQGNGNSKPSLMDYVFELTKQTGNEPRDTTYAIQPNIDIPYSQLDEDIEEIMNNIPQRPEFMTPADLLEFKRYRPQENNSSSNGEVNQHGVEKEYSIADIKQTAGTKGDDW